MRTFLASALLAILLIGGSTLTIIGVPRSYEPEARAATGAIFVGPERQFDCSGTEIGHTKDGDGVFLTARHCVSDPSTNKINERMQISFSDNLGGPYFDAVPIAISLNDDLALLLVRNGANIPEVRIRDNRVLHAGDPIFNSSFPLGLGKLTFHGEYVAARFPVLPPDLLQQYPMWINLAATDITFGHGSSGSGIFSNKERGLVGVVVATFDEHSLGGMIPANIVLDFLADLKDNTVQKFVYANPEKEAVDLF